MKRYISKAVEDDLKDKMVFIGGPRQVGKTTFALSFLKDGSKKHPAYFNWDVISKRKSLSEGILPSDEKLIVLDEIHKYLRWRNLVKGFYDEYFPDKTFLITGSAKLDHYRRGGDSLLGRYHYYRLHPLTPCEINSSPTKEDIKQLLTFGGFPEPFFKANSRTLRRWQLERAERVIKEDLRDLENVKEISLLQVLLDALPSRVGSPLSIKSLREDLEVAHETVARWIEIFDNLYMTYRISPYGSPRIKAVKKEQKLYFWDWSVLEDPGARFENFVGSLLLKFCHHRQDTDGYKTELLFLRDKDKREVDFVVVSEKKPLFAVECKTGEREISRNIKYFSERTPIPVFYQVHLGQKDYEVNRGQIRVIPIEKFCVMLGLP